MKASTMSSKILTTILALAMVAALSVTFTLIPVTGSGATLINEDFEDGIANGFTVVSGAWSVIDDGSKVYKTNATDSLSRSVAGDASWTDYEIETRVKVNSWGSEVFRTAGILARYVDTNNYYIFGYDVPSGVLKIKKKVGGTQIELTSKSFAFQTGTWYIMKAVLSGSSLKLYVNGTEELTATDSSLSAGKVGLISAFGDARFDYITATAASAPLISEDFEDGIANGFTVVSGNWSVIDDGSKVYKTNATDSLSRSVAGDASWTDYEIETRVKVNSWGSEVFRTAGILARYVDTNNYYIFGYDVPSGVLKIKKKVGGTQIELTSKSFAFQTGTWYTMKAVLSGSSLKLYVNGTEELTATDSSLSAGKVGLISAFGDARFDYIIAAPIGATPTSPPTQPPTATPTPTLPPTQPPTATPAPTPTPGGYANPSVRGPIGRPCPYTPAYNTPATHYATASTLQSVLNSVANLSGTVVIETTGLPSKLTGGSTTRAQNILIRPPLDSWQPTVTSLELNAAGVTIAGWCFSGVMRTYENANRSWYWRCTLTPSGIMLPTGSDNGGLCEVVAPYRNVTDTDKCQIKPRSGDENVNFTLIGCWFEGNDRATSAGHTDTIQYTGGIDCTIQDCVLFASTNCTLIAGGEQGEQRGLRIINNWLQECGSIFQISSKDCIILGNDFRDTFKIHMTYSEAGQIAGNKFVRNLTDKDNKAINQYFPDNEYNVPLESMPAPTLPNLQAIWQ